MTSTIWLALKNISCYRFNQSVSMTSFVSAHRCFIDMFAVSLSLILLFLEALVDDHKLREA